MLFILLEIYLSLGLVESFVFECYYVSYHMSCFPDPARLLQNLEYLLELHFTIEIGDLYMITEASEMIIKLHDTENSLFSAAMELFAIAVMLHY